MIENSHGLVLRTRPLTETSLIVHWLTARHGRLATVAKGARRPKSPFRGKLDLFFAADFSFSRSRHSELHALREVSVLETHTRLRQDLEALHQACYAAALVEQTTETETPIPAIYTLTRDFVAWVAAEPARSAMVFAFELKLLEELGLQPDLSNSRLKAGTVEIVRLLTRAPWQTISNLRVSAAQKAELSHFLHGFILFHLGKIPATRAAALGS